MQSWSCQIYSLLQVQSIAIILEKAVAMVQVMVNSLEAFTKLFDELHLIMGWACDFIIGLMPYGVV